MGSPLFKKVTLDLENGNSIVITADKNNQENRYIDEMIVDGETYTKNYLTHKQLMNGAKIAFKMSNEPNKTRGTKESDFPYSFSNDLKTSQPKLWKKINKR